MGFVSVILSILQFSVSLLYFKFAISLVRLNFWVRFSCWDSSVLFDLCFNSISGFLFWFNQSWVKSFGSIVLGVVLFLDTLVRFLGFRLSSWFNLGFVPCTVWPSSLLIWLSLKSLRFSQIFVLSFRSRVVSLIWVKNSVLWVVFFKLGWN